MAREVPAHVQAIAEAAVTAPSGDNSQPWHFVFRAPDTLEFHAHPEYDHPILNVGNGGTLIALGAAIENAVLEANALGYMASLIFSDASEGMVASMHLVPGGALSKDNEELHKAIRLRTSNRKPFDTRPISAADRTRLLMEATSVSGLSFTLVEDRERMIQVANALTLMEQIALSHKILHGHFFSSIFWSDERNEAGEQGLHGKTLELPLPAQALFRILKHWPVARTLAMVGFPKFVAKTNAQQNASASAFGCITADSLDAKTYIDSGRLLERIWLRATALGLSFQVVTGMLFLARHMGTKASEGTFSTEEIRRGDKAYAIINELFATGARHPVIAFRLGYGKSPTMRSRRKAPRIEVVE